jgi:hypothetical protein
MSTLVEATVTQLLEGMALDGSGTTNPCTMCGSELGVTDYVRVYASRMAGTTEWSLQRLYCHECQSGLVSTLGATEIVAKARLGSTLLPRGRTHTLCLTDVTVVETSEPELSG